MSRHTCSKEERRAQLAKAAGDMKNTGKAESAFEDSGYAVGEGVNLYCAETCSSAQLSVVSLREGCICYSRHHSTGRGSL